MEERLEFLEKEIDRIQLDLQLDPSEPSQRVDFVVDGLWVHYRDNVPYRENAPKRPLLHLVQDMQRQAMVYMNIIEQLKSGKEPTDIRTRFEELQLVPADTVPNPNGRRLLNWALNKIERYREALVDIVKRLGRNLLFEDLKFAQKHSLTVELQLGVSPAVSIGVEVVGD